MPQASKDLYSIKCLDENSRILSSEMELRAWDSVEFLVKKLLEQEPPKQKELFGWKYEKSHVASARESYGWRSAIDCIKEANLSDLGGQEEKAAIDSVFSLVRSRPIMLRLAGEITNALIHSYDTRHRLSFSRRICPPYS
jgi:hypothetical protein